MRRYPFERAAPQSTQSETVYIDRDGAEESSPRPMERRRIATDVPAVQFNAPPQVPAPQFSMPAYAQQSDQLPLQFSGAPKPAFMPELSANQVEPPASLGTVEPLANAAPQPLPHIEVPKLARPAPFEPNKPLEAAAAEPMPDFLYRKGITTEHEIENLPFRPQKQPNGAPADLVDFVSDPAQKAPRIDPEVREIVRQSKAQPTGMTDEQINAMLASIKQAPRVSLLSMPVYNKLFSEEYADAERL